MLLKVSKAEYFQDYTIKLNFNDGFESLVDLKDKVFNDHRKIFHALKDIEFFKSFSLNRWTINWPNKLDLAPEYLYELAKNQSENTANNA